MGTGERRERELREREAALLRAAAELLDRPDWQAVTVEEIAARAEYAKGTVYKHFACKDELLARLAAAWAAELEAELQGIDAARPFEAVLAEFVAIALRHLAGDGPRARLAQFVRQPHVLAALPPAARAALAEADARRLALLEGLIDLGVAEGALPDGPLPPRVFAAQALLEGSFRLPGGAEHAPAVAAAMLGLLRAPAAVPA